MASLRSAAAAPVSFTDENALHPRHSSKQSAASSSSSRSRGLSGGSGSVSKRAASSSASSRRALGDITNKERQHAASAQLKKGRAAAAPLLSASSASSLSSSASPLPCADIEQTLGLTFAEQCARETETDSGWVQDGELTAAECQAVVQQLTSQATMKRMFETEEDRFLPFPTLNADEMRGEEAVDAVDLQEVERLQLELNLNFDLGF